jgi:hypothetical protein
VCPRNLGPAGARGARVGKAVAAELGLTFTSGKTGEDISGTRVSPAQLASGRIAMTDDGIGFELVPWLTMSNNRSVGNGDLR